MMKSIILLFFTAILFSNCKKSTIDVEKVKPSSLNENLRTADFTIDDFLDTKIIKFSSEKSFEATLETLAKFDSVENDNFSNSLGFENHKSKFNKEIARVRKIELDTNLVSNEKFGDALSKLGDILYVGSFVNDKKDTTLFVDLNSLDNALAHLSNKYRLLQINGNYIKVSWGMVLIIPEKYGKDFAAQTEEKILNFDYKDVQKFVFISESVEKAGRHHSLWSRACSADGPNRYRLLSYLDFRKHWWTNESKNGYSLKSRRVSLQGSRIRKKWYFHEDTYHFIRSSMTGNTVEGRLGGFDFPIFTPNSFLVSYNENYSDNFNRQLIPISFTTHPNSLIGYSVLVPNNQQLIPEIYRMNLYSEIERRGNRCACTITYP